MSYYKDQELIPRVYREKQMNDIMNKCLRLEKENEILINALEFYAHPDTMYSGDCEITENMCEVGGYTAREALEKIKGNYET